LKKVELEESTDIVRQKISWPQSCIICCSQYTWLFGWFGDERDRDVKINIICPATEVHIRKVNYQSHLRLLSHDCLISMRSKSESWYTKLRSYTKNM
jgi:hypothetical protein